MISTFISSVAPATKGGGSISDIYSDKTDDNYGIGQGLTFHADSEDNIAIGENALNSTSGAALSNVAIGTNALTALTLGDYNVAIGHGSCDAMASEGNDYNVAIGQDTLSTADSGESYNVAIGMETMNLVNGASADSNIALGRAALNGGTSTGSYNIAIGAFSMDDSGNAADRCIAIGGYAGSGAMVAATDGTVAIGYQALEDLTAGAGNVAIGYQSQMENAHADAHQNTSVGYQTLSDGASHFAGNTAIGHQSMKALTAGDDNTAVGRSSGTALLTGSLNVFLGRDAGFATTDVDNAVCIGYRAGYADLTSDADGSVFIGYQAGKVVTSAANCTFIGKIAGLEHVTGNSNIAIGAAAFSNTNGIAGSQNIYIGVNSGSGGHVTATSNYNTAVGNATLNGAMNAASNNSVFGYNAGWGITEADDSVAIGYQALMTHTTGARNIAIGSGAMKDTNAGTNTKASIDNVFIGHQSGGGTWVETDSNSDSNYNVAIGNYSMDAAMDGAVSNVAVGYAALGALTTGDYNSIMGAYAGDAITTGTSNVAIGYYALSSEDTNSSNVAIGYRALKDQNGGQRNVAVGYDSLVADSTGGDNVAVGMYAGNLVSTGSGNTLIGYEADVEAATDSYQTRLGHYGALRYMTAQVTLSDFTAVTADDAATNPLLKIPQYGFLNRVTCTVVTASGGTGEYQISLGTAVEAPGDSVAGQVEIIGAGASDLTGCVSRTQATDAAGDTNVDIITAKQLHIFEADLTDADNNGAWMANDMYLYVCHANGSNATNATNAVVRITAEYFGED